MGARKRHADVITALTQLPGVGYLIIGDGPERQPLARLARELSVADRVDFAGQLDPATTLERLGEAWLFVMPSTEEAFGVAYVEALAAGVPALGAAGEPGPAEIAAAGAGVVLVGAGDAAVLATTIRDLLADAPRLAALGDGGRLTAAEHFTWEICGTATLAAYTDVLR